LWSRLLAIALVLFGGTIVALEFFSNPSESVVRYPTRAAAEASGEFSRGSLPDFLPAGAGNICVARNRDTSEVCATFSVPAEGGALMTDVAARGFETVPPRPPSTSRCETRDACNFRQLECSTAAHILVGGPDESGLRPFVAIDAHDHRMCYWTALAD
jgi:hypothetical protein